MHDKKKTKRENFYCVTIFDHTIALGTVGILLSF